MWDLAQDCEKLMTALEQHKNDVIEGWNGNTRRISMIEEDYNKLLHWAPKEYKIKMTNEVGFLLNYVKRRDVDAWDISTYAAKR
eukprot:TRINITY_DN338_c0_g1_i3.p2 TRINITY_DN338_c0_g1~~TRINITY_DN338_c0_g1_i3.p2  ORF type:complete len:84 (-),score=42.97 TRINITY_DN338_c0_g1_i3:29-280(-)